MRFRSLRHIGQTMKECLTTLALALMLQQWVTAQKQPDLQMPPKMNQHGSTVTGVPTPSLSGKKKNFELQQKNGLATRTSGTRKLPLGYKFQKWDKDIQVFVTELSSDLTFSDAYNFKALLLKGNEPFQIDEVTMASDFKNADILDFLLSGIENRNLLRPVSGTFTGSFLQLVTQKKTGTDFITIRSASDRQSMPFGYVYSNNLHLDVCNNAGFTWEYASQGARDGDLWAVETFITQRNCQSNSVVQEWKEMIKLDARRNRVEDTEYIKQNGVFIIQTNFKFEYDDQDREKSFISVLENKKYEFEYDDYAEALTSQFIWNGTEWIQTRRTVKEVSTDAGKTTVTYTFQKLDNGWNDIYRYVNLFDGQKRAIMSSLEYYSATTHHWEMDNFTRIKYANDKIIEHEYYYGGSGSKTVSEYDSKNNLIHSQGFECNGKDNCVQGIYDTTGAPGVVLPKYDFVFAPSGKLDYQVISNFRDGTWQHTDSIANVYDNDGDLIEVFYQHFPTDERTRYTISYKQDITTSIEETQANSVTLYPNPVTDKFAVKTAFTHYEISLYDLKGNFLSHYRDVKEIDISSQPPGMYILFIDSPGRHDRQKIVKY
jgi:hypothetical protein